MHSWKFFRTGGIDQVALESGADLLALDELDQVGHAGVQLAFATQTLQRLGSV